VNEFNIDEAGKIYSAVFEKVHRLARVLCSIVGLIQHAMSLFKTRQDPLNHLAGCDYDGRLYVWNRFLRAKVLDDKVSVVARDKLSGKLASFCVCIDMYDNPYLRA
jgi:hypothetical protein